MTITKKAQNEKISGKHFAIRMSLATFSYMHERFNDSYKEAIINMGFGCFSHFEISKICGKFALWLLERFDPYEVRLCLLEKKEIFITAMDVHLTFALSIGGRNVVEVRNKCSDKDFELVLHELRAY